MELGARIPPWPAALGFSAWASWPPVPAAGAVLKLALHMPLPPQSNHSLQHQIAAASFFVPPHGYRFSPLPLYDYPQRDVGAAWPGRSYHVSFIKSTSFFFLSALSSCFFTPVPSWGRGEWSLLHGRVGHAGRGLALALALVSTCSCRTVCEASPTEGSCCTALYYFLCSDLSSPWCRGATSTASCLA